MIKHINKNIGSRFYIVIILTFFVSLLEIAMISLMAPIMTMLSGNEIDRFSILDVSINPTIEIYLAALVFTGIFIGIIGFIQGRGIAKVRTDYEYTMRKLIFDRIINANWKYSSLYKNSFLYSSVTEEVNRNSMALHYLFSIINLFSLTVLYLVAASIISIKFTLITMSVFFIVFLFMRGFILKSKSIGVEMNATNDSFYNSVNEYLSNIRYIKQNKIEEFVSNVYIKVLCRLRDLRYQGVVKSSSIKAIYDPVIVIIIAIMIMIARKIELDMGEFLVLLVIIYRLAPRTSQLQREYHEYLLLLPSVKKVEEIIDNENMIQPTSISFKRSLDSSLSISNLKFSYDRFNLSIDEFVAKPGTITTIVGKSGSGKTTFVDIISGIRDDFEGSILYPNTMEKLNNIEYVTQESVLFNTSIYENLSLSNTIRDDKMHQVCEILGIKEMIDSLEGGFEHVVKNNGNEFSGGQKQRLMLARALVQDPNILILDESTSALDNKTENEILKLLHHIKNELDLVIIMIAHRTSTIVESDYIYQLDEGAIILNGSYSDLRELEEFDRFLQGKK